MIPCGACGHHVRPVGPCPFCGAARVLRAGAVAALLGLSGCVGTTPKDDAGTVYTGSPDTGSPPQDLYGLPVTVDSGQNEYGTTITDTPSTGDTGAR